MTAATLASTYTLDDAKAYICAILADLASLSDPDTYGCVPCRDGIPDLCDRHGAMAAQAARLREAAVAVAGAQDRDEIEAAVIAATDGGNH